MKILYLSHSFPWPLDEGVRLHVYHLIKELSAWHDLHLLSFIESERERAFEEKIRPYCRSVRLIAHRVPKQPWRRLYNMVVQDFPFSVHQFISSAMQDAFVNALQEVRPDVVHIDFTAMARYAWYARGTPIVFFPHDAMSMLFERNVPHERNPFFRWYLAAQARRMARFEERMLPLFARTVVVSPVDRDVLLRRSPRSVVAAIPNGVDLGYFSPQDGAEDNLILFRGIMSFMPNYDAASFFAREVMPIIWRERPKARFAIVGANPPFALRRLAARERRIWLRGRVEDIRVPMRQATVIACPMRIGSGIKNKILESMAMAKAIVATPMSLAGIEARHDRELLVGEFPEDLARCALDLLADHARRVRLGQAARRFVEERHAWKDHARRFSQVYEEAAASRKGAHEASH